MTRTLIATDNFPPRWDGVSRFLDEVLPRLDDHEITVISPDFGSYEIDNAKHFKTGLTSYAVGDYTVPRPSFSLIKREVEKADVVFGQTIGPIGSVAGHYARSSETPLVHYTHSIEWQLVPEAADNHALKRLFQTVTRWYAKWYYNNTDQLITPSRDIQESLHYEGIQTKTSIIPLGVDHEDFKPVNDVDEESRRAVMGLKKRIADDNVLIGYHGRFAREKDLLTLLRAVKRLRRKRQDFRVVIVGDGLSSIRDKFEADPLCTTLEAQSDIHRYVQAFDIYVSTSLTETTSLSTAEAMACGKPVVATPAGYVEDYVSHGINGLLFDFEDNYALTKHLERLLDNEDERDELGIQAHRTATNIFQWDRTADEIETVLDNQCQD